MDASLVLTHGGGLLDLKLLFNNKVGGKIPLQSFRDCKLQSMNQIWGDQNLKLSTNMKVLVYKFKPSV